MLTELTQPSLYWHDYETFGIDPRRDRPSQFAGVRTDYDFNIIGEPLTLYCKIPEDYLPHPEACLLTGITPQLVNSQGVVEAEFIRQIHNQLAKPDTCTLGYNSIRFDDEFTRNCLYRNFYDPYAREWQNGNSRWDLIDVVRATKALRPDGVNWPHDEEGRPIFKLEELTKANGISHDNAHDALADVYATIAFAKLIKSAQPKLYDYLWRNRGKVQAFDLLQYGSYQPLVHVSGRYSGSKNCLAVVLPVSKHPTNNNGIIVYDLSVDPEPMLSLSSTEIAERIFTATADLPEGIERIPLKTVHANKCPVLAPISALRPQDQERLQIDLSVCYANLEKIKQAVGLANKIAEVFSTQYDETQADIDPDLAIYSGGFFSDRDKAKLQEIRKLSAEKLSQYQANFTDKRLPEMLFRYRARNYPESLTKQEQTNWQNFCVNKLTDKGQGGYLTFGQYFNQLEMLRQNHPEKENVLAELEKFARNKMVNFKIPEFVTVQ